MVDTQDVEPIQNFDNLKLRLDDIAIRTERMRGRPHRTKRMRDFTEAFSPDGKMRAQIVKRWGLSAFHVSTRESEQQPWQRHTLNLGGAVLVEGVKCYQVMRPSQNNQPRTSFNVAEFSDIPPATQEIFSRGVALLVQKAVQS